MRGHRWAVPGWNHKNRAPEPVTDSLPVVTLTEKMGNLSSGSPGLR